MSGLKDVRSKRCQSKICQSKICHGTGYVSFPCWKICRDPMFEETSVTRFGEISPLWHNLKNIGYIFEGSFSIWQNVDPTVTKKLIFGKFSLL